MRNIMKVENPAEVNGSILLSAGDKTLIKSTSSAPCPNSSFKVTAPGQDIIAPAIDICLFKSGARREIVLIWPILIEPVHLSGVLFLPIELGMAVLLPPVAKGCGKGNVFTGVCPQGEGGSTLGQDRVPLPPPPVPSRQGKDGCAARAVCLPLFECDDRLTDNF